MDTRACALALALLAGCDAASTPLWSLHHAGRFRSPGRTGSQGDVKLEVGNPTDAPRALGVRLGANCERQRLIVDGAEPRFDGVSCEPLRFRVAGRATATVWLFGRAHSAYDLDLSLE